MKQNTIYEGDCIETMKQWDAGCVQTCITSPPYYGLRDYGHEGQIGLEETPEAFVAKMVEVFREVQRVLRDEVTLWLNLGDSYAGSGGAGNQFGQLDKGLAKYKQSGKPKEIGLKPKDLIGIPWMVAFALRADGWYLRQDIIWNKPNPMPESVRDRCTKAHEYMFLLSKSEKYFFDNEAMKEPAVDGETRNRRSVWTVATRPYKGAHFATFPPALIEPCILAGSRPNDIVLDPFMGSGTTAVVAVKHGRRYIGCELNEEYGDLQDERIRALA
jgi:DNA modification methylase